MKASDRQVNGSHYKDFAIQPSEFIQSNWLGWCEGNVIKYVCRHQKKNGRQDLEKAIHYLQLLIEWEYPDAPTDSPMPAVPATVADADFACGLYRDRPRCESCDEE